MISSIFLVTFSTYAVKSVKH